MPQNAAAAIDICVMYQPVQHALSAYCRVVIPETENPQEANSVYPGRPVLHAFADTVQYFTQSPQCWFSHETAYTLIIAKLRPCIWYKCNIVEIVLEHHSGGPNMENQKDPQIARCGSHISWWYSMQSVHIWHTDIVCKVFTYGILIKFTKCTHMSYW